MSELKIYSIEREQVVTQQLNEIFPFFERPENLKAITPPWLSFRLLTPDPVTMNEGRIIDYTIKVLGRRIRWRSIISTYEPPHCFVDEQLKGPYSFWHHTHRFEACEQGTIIKDRVLYCLPAWIPGFFGDLLNTLYVEPALTKIFDFRAEVYNGVINDESGIKIFGGR